MADEVKTSGADNFAHVPGAGVSPISTHPAATPPSTVARELDAGASRVASQVAPTKIDPVVVGVMANPVLESNPSGCKVTPFSPSGTHDVDSSGRPA